MSAPVLSPAEQAEVDRFGLHDEDVIADLERMKDQHPECAACDATATVAVRLRCCGITTLACDQCLAALRADIADDPTRIYCRACGHRFGLVTNARDVVTVVPL